MTNDSEYLRSLRLTASDHKRQREAKTSQTTGDENRDHGAFKQEDECGADHPDAGCTKRKRDPLAPTPKTVL